MPTDDIIYARCRYAEDDADDIRRALILHYDAMLR